MTSERSEPNRSMSLCDPDVFGDEEQTWGMEKGLDWRLAWQRAIAKAWAMPEYKARLLEQPEVALREVGWVLPKGLEIKIELAGKDARWDARVHEPQPRLPQGQAHLSANGWAVERQADGSLRDRRTELLAALETTVVLRLPPAPEDEKLSALAVADYDALLRACPFTCMTC
jgi:hypothetical protein